MNINARFAWIDNNKHFLIKDKALCIPNRSSDRK